MVLEREAPERVDAVMDQAVRDREMMVHCGTHAGMRAKMLVAWVVVVRVGL